MIAAMPNVAAMPAYALADLSVPKGREPVSLAQNESAFPPSSKAVAAARAALDELNLYPDPDWRRLREAVADVHDVPGQGVLCGAGSMELIACLMHAFAGPGRRVLASDRSYAYLRTATRAAGGTFETVAEKRLNVDVDALLGAVNNETSVVCVVNPGNPTGTCIARDEVVRLRNDLPEQVLLVIDEAYGEFCAEAGAFDLVGRGNTVVLRTLSKAYGLAGLRVGWGLFPPAVAGEVRKLLNPNNVSGVAQAAAEAAMRDQGYMQMVRDETIARRDRFAGRLRALGLDVPESHTNFVLIRFADEGAARRADAALRAEGIVMRGMAGYGLGHCLRATVGREEDMARAADILAAWMSEEQET